MVPLNEPHLLDLPKNARQPGWIQAEAEGCWGPPVIWSGDSEKITLSLEAAGRIEFDVAEDRTPLPIEVSFVVPQADNESLRYKQPCDWEDHQVQCVVPARRLDVRVEAVGHAPVFLWNLEIEAGQTRRFDSVVFEPGASVSGWVEVIGAFDPKAEIEISRRRAAGPRSHLEMERLTLSETSVWTDERGHFVVSGLEPGRYRLTARKDDFASQSVEVDIEEVGQNVALDASLTLVPQSEVSITLEPLVDPWKQAWQVQVMRETEETSVYESVAKGAAADRGTWISPNLDPGRYRISILDSQAGTWRSEMVELVGGAESLFWEMDLVAIRGRVTSKKELAEAEVLLGSGTQAISFTVFEDGSFDGYLPKEGPWPVRLQVSKTRLALDTVDVQRRKGKSYAEIELVLPNTVLSGKVTKYGEPVEALVVAKRQRDQTSEASGQTRRASELSTWSDVDGEFEILGLSPGNIEIRASDRTAESDWLTVSLHEEESSEVELRLTERLTVSGRIFLQDRPVVGAKIIVLPDGNVPTSAVSGIDGRFSFKLQSEVRTGNLLISMERGGLLALAPLRVLPKDNSELRIQLPAGQGRLEMGLRQLTPETPVQSLADLVTEGTLHYGGASVSVRQILNLFPPADSRFEGGVPLPPVAAGWWQFCPADPSMGQDCQQFQVLDGSSHLILGSLDQTP